MEALSANRNKPGLAAVVGESRLMRTVNREIRRQSETPSLTEPVAFFCEYRDPACHSTVRLSAAAFDATLADRSNCWPLPGHTPSASCIREAPRRPGKPGGHHCAQRSPPQQAEIPSRKIIFGVTNLGQLSHTFKLGRSRVTRDKANSCEGESTRTLNPGQSANLTVILTAKGKYEYLCTVPGHAAAGMKGLISLA